MVPLLFSPPVFGPLVTSVKKTVGGALCARAATLAVNMLKTENASRKIVILNMKNSLRGMAPTPL